MRILKTLARHTLPRPIFDRLKTTQRRLAFRQAAGFSDEEPVIRRYLDALPLPNRYCVDIAAQDGVLGSQTLRLFKSGWSGIAVEKDPRMFAILAELYAAFDDAHLVRTGVTPDNVVAMLQTCGAPKDFAFLSLDIDSYDYFILERILSEYRPLLMCIEINEVVPPPIRFAVHYRPDHAWEGGYFQGQSLSQCHELCAQAGYDIVELFFNNLFLVPREINPFPALTPEAAYAVGYADRPGRREKFPWNAEMEPLLTMPTVEAIRSLDERFARYKGRYILR